MGGILLLIFGVVWIVFHTYSLCFLLLTIPFYVKKNITEKWPFYIRYLPFLLAFFGWVGLLMTYMYKTRKPLKYAMWEALPGFLDSSIFFSLVLVCNLLVFTAWTRMKAKTRPDVKGKKIYMALLAAAAVFVLRLENYNMNHYWIESGSDVPGFVESCDTYDYNPMNQEKNSLPVALIQSPYPVLDGDPAVQPLYYGLAEHLYDNGNSGYGGATASSWQYMLRNKLSGQAVDVVFAPEPLGYLFRREQYKFTRIARVPFVFVVNSTNPVDSITTEQIRQIYKGRTDNWSNLGGEDDKIIKFHQYAESFSYSMMKNRVMQEEEMAPSVNRLLYNGPLFIEYTRADYVNYENALGYTLLPHAWELVENGEAKLLEIDGVPAVWENFMDGSYPYMVDIYAVTEYYDKNENVTCMLQWLTSEEGQTWIAEAGYFPL